MTLADLNIGEKAVVQSIDHVLSIRDRLFEMGLTPHTPVKVIRFAPFGDPMEIELRGYRLLLRKEEAKHVRIRLIRK